MRLIMIEIFIMNFGGFLFNPHYLHTLMHDVIKTHYEPPKFIMSISIIMSLIMTLLVFQCAGSRRGAALLIRGGRAPRPHPQRATSLSRSPHLYLSGKVQRTPPGDPGVGDR